MQNGKPFFILALLFISSLPFQHLQCCFVLLPSSILSMLLVLLGPDRRARCESAENQEGTAPLLLPPSLSWMKQTFSNHVCDVWYPKNMTGRFWCFCSLFSRLDSWTSPWREAQTLLWGSWWYRLSMKVGRQISTVSSFYVFILN